MVNWERVNDLRAEVEEDFDEIVGLFREEVEEVLARLRDRPDPARLEADLHFLKGSSLNLGFSTFSAMCLDGERMMSEGRATDIAVSPLIACYHTSLAAFMGGEPPLHGTA